MDTAQIRREFVGSIRLLGAGEARLLAGAVAVAVGFAVWVGATGAALNFGLDLGEQPTSVAAWEATSTVALGLVVLLWVVLPAVAVTYLVDRAVTNANGNVHQRYRVTHPFLLVAPFLLLFAVGVVVAVGLGSVPGPLLAGLSVVGLFALVRTVPASYRVFSFSRPRFVEFSLCLALAVDAIAIPVSAATLTGRQAMVDAAAAGIGAKFGTTAVETLLVGSTTVGGLTVPNLLAATAGVPVALTLLYFVVQLVVAQVTRMRSPDVPRGELRTGQRYPDFAHPMHGKSTDDSTATTSSGSTSTTTSSSTTATAGSAGTSSTSSGSASGSASAGSAGGSAATTSTPASTATTGSGASTETASVADAPDDEDDEDDVSHTKVFKPPSDDDFDSPSTEASETTSEDTAVVSEDGYVCPSCEDRYGADASFDYCPTCGSELESA